MLCVRLCYSPAWRDSSQLGAQSAADDVQVPKAVAAKCRPVCLLPMAPFRGTQHPVQHIACTACCRFANALFGGSSALGQA